MPRSKTAPWKLALAALFCAIGLYAIIGHYWTHYRVDQDVRRLRVIVAALKQSDGAYFDLKVVRSTVPQAFIFGTVASPAQVDTIREKVAEEFGTVKATRMVRGIRVSAPVTSQPGGP